jgi:hypothetical protein
MTDCKDGQFTREPGLLTMEDVIDLRIILGMWQYMSREIVIPTCC